MSTIRALDYLPATRVLCPRCFLTSQGSSRKTFEVFGSSYEMFESRRSAGYLSKFSEVFGLTVELSLDGLWENILRVLLSEAKFA